MDKPVKICGSCDYFRDRGGVAGPICVFHGKAISKISFACNEYRESNDKSYKTPNWPFRRVDFRQDQVCELKRVDYNFDKSWADDDLVVSASMKRIEAAAIDMADRVIVEEVIRVARQMGVDTLYLMDKQFVLDALREKLEREGYGRK